MKSNQFINKYEYHPFGVGLKNRDFSGEKYRYGFQGQEKDDELKGKGNSVNFAFRMHDTRLGRFLSIDPLSTVYPHNSPYAFCENKVIAFKELEGLECADATSEKCFRHGSDKYKGLKGENNYDFHKESKTTSVTVYELTTINYSIMIRQPNLGEPVNTNIKVADTKSNQSISIAYDAYYLEDNVTVTDNTTGNVIASDVNMAGPHTINLPPNVTDINIDLRATIPEIGMTMYKADINISEDRLVQRTTTTKKRWLFNDKITVTHIILSAEETKRKMTEIMNDDSPANDAFGGTTLWNEAISKGKVPANMSPVTAVEYDRSTGLFPVNVTRSLIPGSTSDYVKPDTTTNTSSDE